MTIDFSKAPEGATHYQSKGAGVIWAYCDHGDEYVWVESAKAWIVAYPGQIAPDEIPPQPKTNEIWCCGNPNGHGEVYLKFFYHYWLMQTVVDGELSEISFSMGEVKPLYKMVRADDPK